MLTHSLTCVAANNTIMPRLLKCAAQREAYTCLHVSARTNVPDLVQWAIKDIVIIR